MNSIIMYETICLLSSQYNALFIATACFKWTDMVVGRQSGQIHPAHGLSWKTIIQIHSYPRA